MAVHVAIKAGADPGYYFLHQGGGDGPPQRQRAEYYLSAVEHGAEPPGVWASNGLASLGIGDGEVVDKDQFLSLYGEFRDPATGEPVGLPLRDSKAVTERFAQLVAAAGPGLTRDEERGLYAQARAGVAAPVRYWDMVFSVDKGTSLAHATAVAQHHAAREAGDEAAALLWGTRADRIREAIEAAVRDAIGYAQRECRYVRTGHHGARIAGAEAGRFEDADEMPVAMFFQHTSRDGDPSLHVHTVWLNRVRTVRDGKWRALDSRAMHRVRGAASAVAALSMESRLARIGLSDWAFRNESHGRVLRAVGDEAIRAFSSRRAAITGLTAGLVAEYRRAHGAEPSQRAVWTMRRAAFKATRRGKPDQVDFAAMLAQWQATSRDAELGTLAQLATRIWADAGHHVATTTGGAPFTPAQQRATMAAGLAVVQEEKAAWTRTDLVRAIATQLPDHVISPDPSRAGEMLDHLAACALGGDGGEQVACLTPAWPDVPDEMRRASDGQSVYRAHGHERYATVAQLATEARMCASARARTAPRIDRARAAQLLGSDDGDLDGWLDGGCVPTRQTTSSGLRLDQAAAGMIVLSSGQRVDVVVGPAGSGKTRLMAALASAWTQAKLGQVVGLAATSSARDTLADASGLIVPYNLAQFLGHMPGGRGERGAVAVEPGTLILLDEATMATSPDLAQVIAHAENSGAKVVAVGDDGQLGAVTSGGGFAMLARKLGSVQLTEAQRLIHDTDPEPMWEANASLQLRAGGDLGVEALATYDDHGRLHGGTYERMTEAAARRFVHHWQAGQDVILTAYTQAECADLSRRVQEQLVKLGDLDTRRSVALRNGAVAYPGDLVSARKNTRTRAGGPDATFLVNGDRVRVEHPGRPTGQVPVRRLDGFRDGQPVWSAPFTVDQAYLAENADLGYALTWHLTEGSTVDVGISLSSERRTRAGLYPSMTRGRAENHVYAYPSTAEPGEYDAEIGDREAQRVRSLAAEAEAGPRQPGVDQRDPVSILAAVVKRDASPLSATETGEQAYAAADHLGALFPVWSDIQRAGEDHRYGVTVRQHLNPFEAGQVLADTDDLWRSLRWAELTGRDGPAVLREAIGQGSLNDARSIPAVLAHRVRKMTEHEPPALRRSWADRVPVSGDPGRDAFAWDIAAQMDARETRAGVHLAHDPPVWLVQALGPPPADERSKARHEWERAAGAVNSFREMTGRDHPGDAIGAQPATTSPDYRAEWARAREVMPQVDGIDMRGLSEGQLYARRAGWERETSWAPVYVGSELRVARKAASDAAVEASQRSLAAAEAQAQARQEDADRHMAETRALLGLEQLANMEVGRLARAHQTWRDWQRLTEPTRRAGKAADEELARRGLPVDQPLRTAEPAPAVEASGGSQAEQDEAALTEMGLDVDHPEQDLPERLAAAVAYNQRAEDKVAERESEEIPDIDPDAEPGPAWEELVNRDIDHVVQPARREIPASEAVLDGLPDRSYTTWHDVEMTRAARPADPDTDAEAEAG